MSRIVVRSSGPLAGRIRVSGAKNSVLKLMAASILADGTHELHNVPAIADVGTMSQLLDALGLTTMHPDGRADVLRIERPSTIGTDPPAELVARIRASIVVLGPLLARCGRAHLTLPGGDDFGDRPIDLHLRALEAMGARFSHGPGVLLAVAPGGLHGAEIRLAFPSVGATENIVMAAVLARGTTVLHNAAREPEITDLCHFLVSLGACIEGIGSPKLIVRGVTAADLASATHTVVPDRVEAATYLAAAGVTGGEVEVVGARSCHMELFLRKLSDMGMLISDTGCGIAAKAPDRLRSVDVATLPYPGVATDYKPLVTAMLSVADGVAIVTENLFSGRFRYVEELQRLGADIWTSSHHAVVRGVPRLVGAPVTAHDIRAGAALVVAGLAAEGETVVEGAHHVDRGYEDLVGKLRGVGALIER